LPRRSPPGRTKAGLRPVPPPVFRSGDRNLSRPGRDVAIPRRAEAMLLGRRRAAAPAESFCLPAEAPWRTKEGRPPQISISNPRLPATVRPPPIGDTRALTHLNNYLLDSIRTVWQGVARAPSRHKFVDRTARPSYTPAMTRKSLLTLRPQWSGSSVGSECSLHQIAPYIGKLKTSIARVLVSEYSSPGMTVLEPFSGSGVVALEALLQSRNVIANDVSPYAAVLTRAKLFAPSSEAVAVRRALDYSAHAKRAARANDWKVDAPTWVRQFFHRRTLAETLILARMLQRRREWFLLGCLLGILHHQRPGFLSYPSSHLVPYLRRRKFPKSQYPNLYQYRDVGPRLIAKVRRAYRRHGFRGPRARRRFESSDIRNLRIHDRVDLVLTSPPYMNALDYGRDNRLRLWFIGVQDYRKLDQRNCRTPEDFASLIKNLVDVIDRCLSRSGRAALVVGEVRRNGRTIETAAIVSDAFTSQGRFRLIDSLKDPVPDISGYRRGHETTKHETIMVFSRK
jgi:hypothetical protein